MQCVFSFASNYVDTILNIRSQAKQDMYNAKKIPIQWKLDDSYHDSIWYDGYEY